MRILLLLSESWNDKVHPNNNMSNWFTDFAGTEIFTISGGAEMPQNNCCKDYFMLSDMSMAKSFLPGKKAGKVLYLEKYPEQNDNGNISSIEKKIYGKRSSLHSSFMRLVRDMIWRYGRINKKMLKEYIDYVNPDVIFSQRMGSVKMCRLESVVSKMTSAPIVAYTGDNEYSQDGITGDFISRIHTLWTRAWLDKMIPKYGLYYSMSYEQMKFYEEKFHVKTKFLTKCGLFFADKIHTSVGNPIKLVYAGKLYCGRDKTLGLIADVLRKINGDGVRFVLNIYTGDTLTEEQEIMLNDGKDSVVHGAVSGDKLPEIYDSSDILLHVEGFDKKNVILTKYSFSTKIMDCLSSGCAVMAVCNEVQSGFAYMRKNDIAFTAAGGEELYTVLNGIKNNPNSISEYAKKAYSYCSRNHSREQIQQMMIKDFEGVISENITNKCSK